MPVRSVLTEDLAPGMYVAQLDRPWLETPFLFQGFRIKSEAEVAELGRYCGHVYVDDMPDAQTAGAPAAAPGLADEPGLGSAYTDTTNAEAEMPRAREIYAQSSAGFIDMMDRLRDGGKLDVQMLESAVTPMMESLLRNEDAMTWLSRIARTDDYTYGHSVSCAIYSLVFGRHLGLPREDLQSLGLGGLLLDVGKTRVAKSLLGKPEKLCDEELALVREHVRHGVEILHQSADVDPRVLEMVRSHHERYDGGGYPRGLAGPEIPVFARIAGIVDTYDALITPRVYAPAVSGFAAMRILARAAGCDYQPEMVEQFVQAVGMFPNGALVELSTGEVGIVVEQNRVRRLRPKIMVILDRDKQALAKPATLDLRNRPAERGEADAIWIDRGLEVGAFGIDADKFFI